MAFSQDGISNIRTFRDDANLLVTWASTQPDGTIYQLYLDRVLVDHGPRKYAKVPYPGGRRHVSIDVGHVAAGEAAIDFLPDLPAGPLDGSRPHLAWSGGTFLAEDIEGFNIYIGMDAGEAVDYTVPIAVIPAYVQGQTSDGYGMGGYGEGGYGYSASSYEWTGDALAPGEWHFGVKAFDHAGNESAAVEDTITITGPPLPVPELSPGVRVSTSYNILTNELTLSWMPVAG